MRKVPVFLLAISLAALLAGCAGQAVPLRGAAQLGALSAAAVTSEAVSDEKQDVPAPADAPDVENPADPAQDAKPQENTQQPEGKADAPESPVPDGEGQPDVPEQPTTPEQPVMPMPQPEPAPSESEPTPAPVQEPGPTPTPEPEPEPKLEPADRWAAVETANAYAAAQYGVTTDSGLTLGNSAYRFPASVAADASQETLEAKARDMVDYTFRQLMMQAGADTLADAGLRCNVCIVEDGASLLIYVLYAG
mgnify:CR=1 FL=1